MYQKSDGFEAELQMLAAETRGKLRQVLSHHHGGVESESLLDELFHLMVQHGVDYRAIHELERLRVMRLRTAGRAGMLSQEARNAATEDGRSDTELHDPLPNC